MTLRYRHVPVDFLPQEGVVINPVNGVDDEVLNEAVELNRQYENLSVFKDDLGEFMKNDKFAGFQVSASEILYQMQQTLVAFVKRNNIIENDKFAEQKEIENNLALEAIKNIGKIYTEVFNTEFPDKKLVRLSPHRENIYPLRKKPFKTISAAKCAELDLARKVIEPAYKMCMYINQVFPNYKNNRVTKIAELSKKLFMKVNGQDVMYKADTPEETFAKLAPRIESLIVQDYDVSERFSRLDAMNSLSRELGKIGLELEVVYVNKLTPQEDLLDMTKTCILRADWDGFITRPDPSKCSAIFRDHMYEAIDHIPPSRYDLKKNQIFNLCNQMESFRTFTKNGKTQTLEELLAKGLGQRGFPPEKIEEIRYDDIAYLINESMGIDADTAMKFARNGTKAINAVQIPSARKEYFKNMVREHRDELEAIFRSQHISEKRINKIISSMLEGSVPDKRLHGHHTININQHAEFEKETGLPWYEMNKRAVVLVDPTTHYFIHMIENFVSAQGKVSDAGLAAGGRNFEAENNNVSTRTIFIDNNTGQQYFFTVRVKQYGDKLQEQNKNGNLNVVALFENLTTIFNKGFMAQLIKEKTKEHSLEDAQKHDIKAEKDRIEKRGKEVEEKRTDKKPQHKEETSRPNYQGLGAHGAHRNVPLAQKRILGA